MDGEAFEYFDADLTSSATVRLKVVDKADNEGPVTTQQITIDTELPTNKGTVKAITDDTGYSDADFVTSDNDGLIVTVELDQSLAADERLMYLGGDGQWIDITASVVGKLVSYNDKDLTSTTDVKLKVVDAAGNDGPVTSKTITIDTGKPTTTVRITGISEDTGSDDGD